MRSLRAPAPMMPRRIAVAFALLVMLHGVLAQRDSTPVNMPKGTDGFRPDAEGFQPNEWKFVTDPKDPKYDTRTDPNHADFEGPIPIEPVGEESGRMAIDRRHKLSYDEFVFKYMATGTPVIITGVASEWPAVGKWTPEWLEKQFPDAMIKKEWGSDQGLGGTEYVRLPDFFAYMRNSSARVPAYGEMGTHQLGINSGGLMDDVEIPHYFADDYMVLCTGQPHKKTTARALYIGAKHSGIENHQDALATFAYSVQVYGRKRWRLYPGYLAEPLADGAHDVYRPTAPSLKHAKPFYDFILNPGEILFWSGHYYHATYVIETSIAMSENFVNYWNYNEFKNELFWDCEHENLPQKFCLVYKPICSKIWEMKYRDGPYYKPCPRKNVHSYCDHAIETNVQLDSNSTRPIDGVMPEEVHRFDFRRATSKSLKKIKKVARKASKAFIRKWKERHAEEQSEILDYLYERVGAWEKEHGPTQNNVDEHPEPKRADHGKDEL